jgi:arylsulfatase A-like enzyme
VLSFAIAAVAAALALGSPGRATAVAAQPNVIVILTDDQDSSELRLMRKTRRLLVNRGASFKRYYDSDPLCCPSRATFLTGQYAHNHQVRSNTGSTGGYAQFKRTGDIHHTINLWLQGAGYSTGFVGKFLNGYGLGGLAQKREIPPGWDEWDAAPGSSETKMYDYRLNRNGTLYSYGHRPRHYQTDVYAKLAAKYIRRTAGVKPFFLTVAPLAPHDDNTANETGHGVHGPAPAPRHKGDFANLRFRKKPNFDEANVSDKPRYVQRRRRLTSADVAKFVASYRRRAESLLAVDDLVARLVSTLKDKGVMGDTYIFFTSDNGYLLGEHRLETKSYPYEESVRVPLVVRGPGIPPGVSRAQQSANVDLAPTLLDIAGVTVPADNAGMAAQFGHPLDGVSMLPFAQSNTASSRPILLESFSTSHYRGVESWPFVYVRYNNGEKEMYNLRRDRYQLKNIVRRESVADRRQQLEHVLTDLSSCDGTECTSLP